MHFAVRRFLAKCPKCGPFSHDRSGHHSTLSNKEMDKLFPKAHRKRVKNALSLRERLSFDWTLRGWRMPKDREVDRWLEIQEQLLRTG